jgi:hypothetical protein
VHGPQNVKEVTHQLSVSVDDVNMLGGSVHTVERNAGSLVVISKEIGPEVNADKLSTSSCLELGMQDEITI